MNTNEEQNEQTRWLISYLEGRFSRLEDRLNSVAEGLENRLDSSLKEHTEQLREVEDRLNQVENDQLKLSSQAGLIKNLLAFVGTIVVSLLGWAASTFIFPSGK
jgi:hypothetical protein